MGLYRREALDKVYRTTASFSPGPSPDIANAAALCLLIEKHIFVNMPIIISGFSFKARRKGTRGQHVACLKDVPWLSPEVVEKWNRKIPFIWTGETIWAESMLKALERLDAEEFIKEFNWTAFYAVFIKNHLDYIKLAMLTSAKSSIMGVIRFFPVFIFKKIVSVYKRKIRKIQANIHIPMVDRVESLELAFDILNEYNESSFKDNVFFNTVSKISTLYQGKNEK